MRLSAPHTPRAIVRWLITMPLVWLAFVLVCAGISTGLAAYVGLRVDSASSTSGLESSSTSLQRIHPIAQFAASGPMLATLHGCESLGKWLLPISGPCLAADIGASSSVAATTLASAYTDLTANGLMRNHQLDMAALSRFAGTAPDVDARLRDADAAVSRALTWNLLPAGWSSKLQRADDAIWRVDSAILATPSILRLIDGSKPARFFVGLTSQAETRAGGGLLGMYAIVSINHGRIAFDRLGNNLDLKDSKALPTDLPAAFYSLFGTGNPEWQNLNVAPDGPTSGHAWLAAWQATTGEHLDGAIAIDTLTLGRLCAAAGIALREATGRKLVGADAIADYASYGVYTEFGTDDLARKAHQTQVFAAAVKALFGAVGGSSTLVAPLVRSITEHHAWVYLDRPILEQALKSVGAAGWIGDLGTQGAQMRFNNLSANKADFLLHAVSASHTVAGHQVLTVTLSLDPSLKQVTAPLLHRRLDPLAATGSGTYLQVLLSVGSAASIDGVRVNGSMVEHRDASYDGSPTAAFNVNLLLGKPLTLQFDLSGSVNVAHLLDGALVHS